MINFHLRRNLLLALIIVLIGIIWIVVVFFPSDNNVDTLELSEASNYIEKIDNFSLQTFDSEQKLAYIVKAESYFNFKRAPALLINPVVITYNKKGEQTYTMSAKHANYLDNGEIELKDKVTIKSKTGAKINTKNLIINQSNNNEIYYTKEKVRYQSKSSGIYSSSMLFDAQTQTIKLTGGVTGRYE